MLTPAFSTRKLRLAATVCGLCVALYLQAPLAAVEPVSAADFGAKPDNGSDTTPAVRAALSQCVKTHARKLIFAPGRYDFWPDYAEDEFLFITNNDPGLRRVAFGLTATEDMEIDGGGARFVFHGNILPFVLDHSRNIDLHNFSIDWERPFHSEAKVLKVDDLGLDVAITAEFPYEIDHGALVFLDEQKKPMSRTGDILAFDPVKGEVAFMASDQSCGPCVRAHETAPGQVRIEEKLTAQPGNALVMSPADRLYPAITVSDSAQTHIRDVNIYHAGGMGVVAQRSRDIRLEHVQVMPPPGGKRVCSLTADATHFSNCSGQIVMDGCVFENQMDDATNIHGIYSRISRRLGPQQLEVELVHPQQWGFDSLTPGERVEFVHSDSLVTYGEGAVGAVERRNSQFTAVTLDAAPPDELRPGDVVAVIGAYPDVRITHCYIGRNRARGLLLGSRGKIVIEDNVFHTAGAAILLEGDAKYWFEQSGVRDLTIRRNRFESCNYGVWGNAVFQIGAGIAEDKRSESRYNRNIVIEDNVFNFFDPRLINAYCVDGLTYQGNRIERSNDYPAQHENARPFQISDSDNVRIDDARYDRDADGGRNDFARKDAPANQPKTSTAEPAQAP